MTGLLSPPADERNDLAPLLFSSDEATNRRSSLENEGNSIKRQSLMRSANVEFEVVTWAPSQADVDLSVACMFERETPGAHLSGGLKQLDEALGGALTGLREEGSFRAQEMETVLVRKPPMQVRAQWILIIGLGNPLTLSSETLERALRVSVREAIRVQACTVAFAPNLLDAGLTDLEFLHVEAAMVRGVISGLHAEYRLAEIGLAALPEIQRWAFETGSAHFEAVTGELLRAFNRFAEI
jgi:hypothetical protein